MSTDKIIKPTNIPDSEIMISEALTSSLLDEINELQSARDVFQHFYTQTKTIERLKENMESVILLGDKNKKVPENMLLLLNNLGQHIINQPVKELQLQFARLSRLLNQDLIKLHDIVLHLKKHEHLDDYDFSQYHEIVEEYVRRARTAIAMRVALKQHKIELESKIQGILDPQILKNDIHYLRVKEKQAKHHMKFEISHIRDKIITLQNNQTCPLEVLEHINEINLELDEILLSIEHNQAFDALEVNKKLIDDYYLKNYITKLSEKKNTASPVTDESNSNIAASSKETENAQMSFWKKLWLWLNTPWSKSWKSIE